MKSLFLLCDEIQKMFVELRWRFCFIGGIALQRWGEPRLTHDVDISLLTGFGNENHFIDILCQQYIPRIENVKDFALDNRVLLIKSETNIPIDISLAGLPFEELVIDRSSEFQFLENIRLTTCSAEDLIIYKAFADRTRDWADIEGIIIRQKNNLDRVYIETKLLPLCELKESPHIMQRIKKTFGAME